VKQPLLTADEAAAILGITPNRVCQLIRDGRLPAQRFGRQYSIRAADVERFKPRSTGRPKKSSAGG
jgi:excisionase family DNA binding protein